MPWKEIDGQAEKNSFFFLQERLALNYPPKKLTVGEEEELIKKGTPEAFWELLSCNMLFVVKIAKQYSNRGLSMAELYSLAIIGAHKAFKKYKPKGYKFMTYARCWIEAELQQAFAERIDVPLWLTTLKNKILRAIDKLQQKYWSEQVPIEELASLVGEPIKVVENVFNLMGYSLGLMRFVRHDNFNLFSSPLTAPDEGVLAKDLGNYFHKFFQSLPKKEKRAFQIRNNFPGTSGALKDKRVNGNGPNGEKNPWVEVAAYLNTSHETVRGWAEKAENKLREKIEKI